MAIDPTEWDFSRCPQHQLPFCLVYEYARASEASIEQVTEWRVNNSWPEALPFEEAFWMRGLPRVVFLRCFPEFPGKPWQQIPNNTRTIRIEALPEYDAPVTSVSVDAFRDEGKYLDLVRHATPRERITILPLKINWAFSDDRLGKEFRRWAARHREEVGFPADERHAPTTPKEQLKKLAAHRLLKEFNAAQAIEHTKTLLPPEPGTGHRFGLYDTPRASSRAAAEAQSLLTPKPYPSLPPHVAQILESIGFSTLLQSVRDVFMDYLTGANAQEIDRLRALPRRQLLNELNAITALR